MPIPLRIAVFTVCLLLLPACSESNNLLLGRVSTNLDTHRIVVTDCYRTEVPPPEKREEGSVRVWRFTPCRDAAIEIRGDKLTVNGRAYGYIDPNDGVLVDHGLVSLQHDGSAQRARLPSETSQADKR
jgi:hypothetical protein